MFEAMKDYVTYMEHVYSTAKEMDDFLKVLKYPLFSSQQKQQVVLEVKQRFELTGELSVQFIINTLEANLETFRKFVKLANNENLQVFECVFGFPNSSKPFWNNDFSDTPGGEKILYERAIEYTDTVNWGEINFPFPEMLIIPKNVNDNNFMGSLIIGALITKNTAILILYDGSRSYQLSIIENGCLVFDNANKHFLQSTVILSLLVDFIKEINQKQSIKFTKGKILQHLPKMKHKNGIKLPLMYHILETKIKVTEVNTYVPKRTNEKCDHQVKVRGHYMRRIMHGLLPISDKLLYGLSKNPNRIMIFGIPDDSIPKEVIQDIELRGISFRENQWVSYLRIWKNDSIRYKDKPLPDFKTIRSVE